MPVVVMHGGGGGGYVGGGKNARPNSHLCMSIVATLVNPIFGLNLSAIVIGVGAQSTLGGHQIFSRKICIKNQQNARILHDSCPKNYQNARIL